MSSRDWWVCHKLLGSQSLKKLSKLAVRKIKSLLLRSIFLVREIMFRVIMVKILIIVVQATTFTKSNDQPHKSYQIIVNNIIKIQSNMS